VICRDHKTVLQTKTKKELVPTSLDTVCVTYAAYKFNLDAVMLKAFTIL
jgi:hypothetical protein